MAVHARRRIEVGTPFVVASENPNVGDIDEMSASLLRGAIDYERDTCVVDSACRFADSSGR